MFSSCKLSEVWEGGPLFGFTGRFIGMNLVPSMEKSFFVPVRLIHERLQHFATSRQRTLFLARVNELKPERFEGRLTDIPNSHPGVHAVAPNKDCNRHLEALGYPRPFDSGLILVNTFEEPFGDVYRHGVWKPFGIFNSVKVFARRYVEVLSPLLHLMEIKDFFACSGTFIDWHDKFQDNECQTILTSACLIRNPDYPYDGGSKIIDGLRIQV
ncbi:hypothetical protein PVAP13_1KG337610 [Panicum virgatum]|uniref:Uncharacterized protein n=1 Tax=Panicum virgatum TaxID=38727 RepID=A0A8T0XPD6_PANVG|nr:hypothetical protein PVAP13_1KG337610 [Panicum virgatum]